MSKIAVSAGGPTLDAEVDARFGHCPFYLLVDPGDLTVEPVKNPHVRMARGAGVRVAKLLSDREAGVVLTGHCGPGAGAALAEKGIKVVTGCSGTAREAVERFRAEGNADIEPLSSATAGGTGRTRRRRRRRATGRHGGGSA